jgi:shikimate kinase
MPTTLSSGPLSHTAPVSPRIILVGFMGTGKTAVGRELAARLERAFVDTDERIAAAAARTIPEIFASEGEAGFRDRETTAIRSLLEHPTAVIATGGGILGRTENIELLQSIGPLVCLTARPEVILERTRPWADRPLLAGAAAPAALVDSLLRERASRYALADLIIDTSDLTVAQVVEEICRGLK